MKLLPHNLGKLMVVVAIAVIAVALLVVAARVAPVTAAPAEQPKAAVAVAAVTTTVPAATQATTATKGAAVAAATAVPEPPPAALVRIIPVPANAALPNAITTTIKQTTDTAVGPKTVVAALMTSGLPNVPISVPVKIQASAADPKFTMGKVSWKLLAPPGSKAKLSSADAPQTSFMPDMVGAYMATAQLVAEDGKTMGELGAVQLHAGMYVGFEAGKCATCHPGKAEEWAKTGHAKIFSDEIDNKRTPDVPSHYVEGCARCHTTGYYPGAANGGFKDAMAKAKWVFPTWKEINAAGKKTGPSNWEKAPAAVKNMGNIQCEVCHGPAAEHVATGAKVMASSQAEGVCNQCHNGGGHHLKGTDLQSAAHADASATAWNYPIGPGEQACVRCHSGNGYASFLADPKNPAGWDNTMQTVVCSTCHDPHSEANTFQLRIVGKPIELPFEAKDAGLSTTCEECHNSRTKSENAVNASFPHYSSVAELMNDTGGVDYGQKLPNSPHGLMVGAAPVPNPAAKDDPEAPKFMFSKADDPKGNTPGPCVVCHMWPTIEDKKDPNYHKVGSHSFNTVSPDGKFDYTAACATCHGEVKDFNLPAKADYDGNGKTEGVQDEVTGLLNVLWQGLESKGLKKLDTGYPYATLPKGADGKTDPKILNAWYNFRTVYGVMWGAEGAGNEGKAQAVHNFKRSVALLQASYKDLMGKDVPGATAIK